MGNASTISLANHILDFLLGALVVWMAFTVAKMRLGGALKKAVNRVVIGAVILGAAHLMQTIPLHFGLGEQLHALLHRGIFLLGFVSLAMGIQSLVRAFGRPAA